MRVPNFLRSGQYVRALQFQEHEEHVHFVLSSISLEDVVLLLVDISGPPKKRAVVEISDVARVVLLRFRQVGSASPRLSVRALWPPTHVPVVFCSMCLRRSTSGSRVCKLGARPNQSGSRGSRQKLRGYGRLGLCALSDRLRFKTKLLFFHSDGLRAAHKAMRCAQFLKTHASGVLWA